MLNNNTNGTEETNPNAAAIAAENAAEAKQIAATIIEQLGGRGIFSMCFVGPAVFDSNPKREGVRVSLQLKIAPVLVPHTNGKATHVIVDYTWADTYTVRAIKHPRKGSKAYAERTIITVAEVSDVYCDQLQDVVEGATGHALTMVR